jgi:hypothetical protein
MAATATDINRVMTGCRAASRPYRVKVRRRGCAGPRTGGSVVLYLSEQFDYEQI